MVLIDKEELENLRYKAQIFDDLQNHCNINCALLLVGILQHDFPMKRALKAQKLDSDLNVCQDIYVNNPN